MNLSFIEVVSLRNFALMHKDTDQLDVYSDDKKTQKNYANKQTNKQGFTRA